jgi:hypothetical protein
MSIIQWHYYNVMLGLGLIFSALELAIEVLGKLVGCKSQAVWLCLLVIFRASYSLEISKKFCNCQLHLVLYLKHRDSQNGLDYRSIWRRCLFFKTLFLPTYGVIALRQRVQASLQLQARELWTNCCNSPDCSWAYKYTLILKSQGILVNFPQAS